MKLSFKLLFSFLLLMSFSQTATAWEQSFEGHWEDLPTGEYITTGTATTLYGNHVILNTASQVAAVNVTNNFTGYVRYNVFPTEGNTLLKVIITDATGGTVYTVSYTSSYPQGYKYYQVEAIESGGDTLTLYIDGASKATATKTSTNEPKYVYVYLASAYESYIKDISTNPFMVGTPGFISSASGTIYGTITVPTANTYHLTLTNPSNEIVQTWNITSKCQSISYSVGTYFSEDGIYYYDIYDANGELYYSKALYYNGLGVYPDTYFTITSDTAAEIKDQAGNGGAITGGGTVSLYPTGDGFQNFTVDFSEKAYYREITLTKIFNTTTLDGSILGFSGLSPMIYSAEIDSSPAGTTTGDTWDYSVSWIGDNTYLFELSPDFTAPGVWGYVKDATTQAPIKSATVSIAYGTNQTSIYTDENGMYYYSNDIAAGQTVTTTVSKAGYSAAPAQTSTATAGTTTRQDFFLDGGGGAGLYYAPHDVSFKIIEYWYETEGLEGATYSIKDNENTIIKTGTTDSNGRFTLEDATAGTQYNLSIIYNGTTYYKTVEPALDEYTYVLIKEGIIHTYINSWVTLAYVENSNNVTVTYNSTKPITGASLTATAANGTQVYTQTVLTDNGTFIFPFTSGDYIIQYHIEAEDGDTASQSWAVSSPVSVFFVPPSYPAWLKNTLFGGVIVLFLLSFGKSKNDIACMAVAILTSLAHYFDWLTCSFNFVVLVWIIALGAVALHYKRTGAVG